MAKSFNGGTDVCFSFSFNEGSPPMVTYKDEESSATRYSGFASIPTFFYGGTVVCIFLFSMKAVLLWSRRRMENQAPPVIQGSPVHPHQSVVKLVFVSLSVSMKAALLWSHTRMQHPLPPDIQGSPVYLHPSVVALMVALMSQENTQSW